MLIALPPVLVARLVDSAFAIMWERNGEPSIDGWINFSDVCVERGLMRDPAP